MQRVVDFLSSQTGWRRWGIAFAAGAVSTMAMAPLHFWPVLFVTFPVLVWQLDGCYAGAAGRPSLSLAALRSAAAVGWAFGFGYFLAGIYWIGFAFLVEADIFAWLLPFAVTLMPAGLAFFFALAAVLAGPLWRPGIARLLGLALALAVAEWLRGQVLTGFPWNTIGYAVTGSEAMMQWSSVFGVYGLTLIAVLVFTAPAALWSPGEGARLTWRGCAYPALMAVVLACAYAWGLWRLDAARVAYVDGVNLRIVQPNIPQKEKWKPENRAAIFERYMAVSRRGAPRQQIDGVTHLIWPESALPFLLEDTPEALNAISAMMPDGSVFITGAARAGKDEREAAKPGARAQIFNSLFVMDHHANLLTHYDKAHLVPFGEYLPFQDTLEAIGLEQLTRVRGGFTAGEGPRLTSAPNVPPFVALICYEIIFPDAIRDGEEAPGWLLNVTNDAWFGDTAGPHQHFHQARVRAVEQGLPLVRAANTGISAVTDPYGRTIAELPRNVAEVIDSPLPRALQPTPFVAYGGLIFVAMLLAVFGIWCILTYRQYTDQI